MENCYRWRFSVYGEHQFVTLVFNCIMHRFRDIDDFLQTGNDVMVMYGRERTLYTVLSYSFCESDTNSCWTPEFNRIFTCVVHCFQFIDVLLQTGTTVSCLESVRFSSFSATSWIKSHFLSRPTLKTLTNRLFFQILLCNSRFCFWSSTRNSIRYF